MAQYQFNEAEFNKSIRFYKLFCLSIVILFASISFARADWVPHYQPKYKKITLDRLTEYEAPEYSRSYGAVMPNQSKLNPIPERCHIRKDNGEWTMILSCAGGM